MIQYLRKYPRSIFVIAVILYLSFFTPPKTNLDEVTNIDKLVHILMYGAFCSQIWKEYLRSHRTLHRAKLTLWAVVAPILMGGLIELLQAYATTTRSGDWLDFAANSLGVLLAVPFGLYVLRPILWRKQKTPAVHHEGPAQEIKV
jgi:VanZ family protein